MPLAKQSVNQDLPSTYQTVRRWRGTFGLGHELFRLHAVRMRERDEAAFLTNVLGVSCIGIDAGCTVADMGELSPELFPPHSQAVQGLRNSLCHSFDNFLCPDDRTDLQPRCLQCRAPSFLPIYQRQNSSYVSARGSHGSGSSKC